MSNVVTNKILVDIQSLFDLRQAALSFEYDTDKLIDFISKDVYNFREFDVFPDLPKTFYKDKLKSKNKHLLPRSTITYIFHVLKTRIDNMEKRNAYYNESNRPEIVVNVYPFVLSEKDQDILKNLIFVKLKSECLISIINVHSKTLSPFYLKASNFVAAYLYSFSEWIEHHADSLSDKSRLDTLLNFPALGEGEKDKEMDKKLQMLGFKDIFTYTTYLFSSAVTITFLPVIFYSNLTTAMVYVEYFNNELKKETSAKAESIDEAAIDEILKNIHPEKQNGDSSAAV